MKWEGRRRSSNIEDRRGSRVAPAAGLSLGGIILALVAVFVFKQDPLQVLPQVLQAPSGGFTTEQGSYQPTPEEEAITDEIAVMLADTEDTWAELFRGAGSQYPPPTLVLYTNMTPTACGTGQAASGPFYCPGDQQIYLDLSFLNELNKMGAPGKMAVAYVVAHEVAHHVQTVTGTNERVRQAQRAASSQAESNRLQVAMELQADCYAGLTANRTNQRHRIFDEGDLKEALDAAAAIGDDAIMRRAGVPPRRESFTHGSSAERMEAFKRGWDTGDVSACDFGI